MIPVYLRRGHILRSSGYYSLIGSTEINVDCGAECLDTTKYSTTLLTCAYEPRREGHTHRRTTPTLPAANTTHTYSDLYPSVSTLRTLSAFRIYTLISLSIS